MSTRRTGLEICELWLTRRRMKARRELDVAAFTHVASHVSQEQAGKWARDRPMHAHVYTRM